MEVGGKFASICRIVGRWPKLEEAGKFRPPGILSPLGNFLIVCFFSTRTYPSPLLFLACKWAFTCS